MIVDLHHSGPPGRGHTDELLKAVYGTITKKAFLDWGLTSAHDVEGRTRERKAPQQMRAAAEQVHRKAPVVGLGGGTSGSELYYEFTFSSVSHMLLALVRQCNSNLLHHGRITQLCICACDHSRSYAGTFCTLCIRMGGRASLTWARPRPSLTWARATESW